MTGPKARGADVEPGVRSPLLSSAALDRRIIRLALPALGALLVEPLYNLTDSAIVGHLGPAPLGALAIATGALNLVWWTTGFIQMATLTRVARRMGAGDLAGVGRDLGAAYLLALLLGILSAAALAGLAAPLTEVLGGRHVVGYDAVIYLRIASIGVVPLVLAQAGTGHQNGLGRTRRPFEIALAASILNVGLEVVLVYVIHLGIAGSAWGTVAAQVAAAAGFAVSSTRTPARPTWPRRADIFALAFDGVPLSVRSIALGIVLLASTAVAARLGGVVLAGHQIALQVWILLALALDAPAVAAQVLIGEAVGLADRSQARAVGRRTLRLALVAGSVLGGMTMAGAGAVPHVFTADSGVWVAATRALLICGAQQPIAAIAFVLDGLLLGASEYRTLSTAMLVALLGFVPIAAAVLIDHSLGIVGVWLALTVWMALRTVVLLRRWRAHVTG